MGKSNSLFIRYSSLHGFYWMSYSCTSSFAAVFLMDHTFSSSEVGLLLAASALLSVFLQPFIAGIADRSQIFTLKRTTLLLCALPIIPCLLLSFVALPKVLIAALYTFVIMLSLSMQPLLNALGMQLLQNGVQFNYGMARATGSMTYALLTFFLGFITVRFSTSSLTSIAFLLYACMFLVLFTMPEMSSFRVNAGRSDGNLKVLKKNPDFLWLILGLSLIFITHSTIFNYMIHILNHIGEGQEAMGQLMAFSAMIEVPAMLYAGHLLKKVECRKLLRFSMSMFLVKVILTAMAPNLLLMYGACSLQAIGFAPYTPAIVYYVSTILNKEDQIKGQALVTVGVTIGNTLGSLFSGFLIDWKGITFALMVASVLCAIGLVFFFYGTKRKLEPVAACI
ncbi:MFS transporter [Chakrabartyella piscis]|uniref:MFS transporter n=1 Tax=Chakrabartyella piscis TaxID=2918914 RepID=UPI0029587FBC|nr:MFS transporter [Chakrabartyella piscis]